MLWIAVVVVFFSLSHSKLPPYIVPVMPMFAMVLGEVFTRLPPATLRKHLLVMGSLLVILAVVIVVLPDNVAGAKSKDVVADLRPETAIGLLLAAASMLCPCWFKRTSSIENTVVTVGAGTLLGLSVLIYGSDGLSATRSGYDLAQQINTELTSRTHLYSVDEYDQTLPFYLKRRMTLVNYRGELDFGLDQEPELGIDTVEAFARSWRNESDAIAVMPPALYTELLDQGLPMRLIGQHRKLVAVVKP